MPGMLSTRLWKRTSRPVLGTASSMASFSYRQLRAVRFTLSGESGRPRTGKDPVMDNETKADVPATTGKRERLEPWRPAFDKILFAIRKVQRLEDGASR